MTLMILYTYIPYLFPLNVIFDLSGRDSHLKVGLWANKLARTLPDQSSVASWSQAVQPDPASQPILHGSGGYDGGSYVQTNYKDCVAGQSLELQNPLKLNIKSNGGITIGSVFRIDSILSFSQTCGGWGFDAWAKVFDFGNGLSNPRMVLHRREWSHELQVGFGNGFSITTANDVFQFGEWVNLIATISVANDGSVISSFIYINGVEQALQPGPPSPPVLSDYTFNQSYIFRAQGTGEWCTQCLTGGSLAALVIYDRYFDASEVVSLSKDLSAGTPRIL